MLVKGQGRYTRVRGWLADRCVTPPMLIDRRNGATPRIMPCLDRACVYEWDEFRERLVRTVERQRRAAYEQVHGRVPRNLPFLRLAGLWGRSEFYTRSLFFALSSLSITTHALDSAYTLNSAGDAVGGRIQMGPTKTLDTVYFFIVSYTGTAANVNDIDLGLHGEASAGASTPHLTNAALESKVKDPASATGWIASTGWTTALTAATRYWIIVADADGGGTDFATINAVSGFAVSGAEVAEISLARFLHTRSTGGFASGNTTSSTQHTTFVLKFSDGSVFGDPITAIAAPSSSSNQRGFLVATDGLVNAMDIFGFLWDSTSASISGMKVFTGSTAPGGSADHTTTDILYGAAGTRTGAMMSGGAAYRMNPGTQYRPVITLSGATGAGPAIASIGTGSDASLRAAMPGSGKWSWTIENAGAWSDDASSLAAMLMLVDADVPVATAVVSKMFPVR